MKKYVQGSMSPKSISFDLGECTDTLQEWSQRIEWWAEELTENRSESAQKLVKELDVANDALATALQHIFIALDISNGQ